MRLVARAVRPAILVATLAAILAGCGGAGPTPTTSPAASQASSTAPSGSGGVDAAAIGRAFIEALAKGDTAAAEAVEDDKMRRAAPAAALGQLWTQIEGQFGAFTGIDGVETAPAGAFVNATVSAAFANATVPLVVTVDAAGHVAGLHLGQPAARASASPQASGTAASPATSAATSPSPPAYVVPGSFTEREVTVGAAPWALPGTLSMPVGGGPFPAVVLLAGSGPQDQDETVGPNAPLRDLAEGLASHGIAVLRYDKRTKAHAAELQADAANVTVREETVDDAVAAVDLLRRTPGVDPARVFVVGHSLGGFLAPRIATQAGGTVAGIGILEGNSSPLQDLIERQFAYLASDAGGADPTAAAALPKVREQVALVNSARLDASTPASSLPLGIPAAYWLDLRGYDPARTAAALAIPTFISQGGRDYQVPPSELDGWRAALAGRANVTIKEYPSLDHLLLEGGGPSRPAEYLVPGHVAAALVDDLAAWVSSNR